MGKIAHGAATTIKSVDTRTPIDKVISGLAAAGCEPTPTKTGYEAICPFHRGDKKNLSVTEGDDRKVLIHCHREVKGAVSCPTKDILSAIGLGFADLFDPSSVGPKKSRAKPPPSARPKAGPAKGEAKKAEPKKSYGERLVKSYFYLDSDHRPVLRVDRLKDPKSFVQFQPDGKRGDGSTNWKAGAKGVEHVPYLLHKIAKAPPDALIFYAEGEKDADRLDALGLFGTCNPRGAAASQDVIDALAPHLAGRHIIILPDNDEPGRAHAERVAATLNSIAASVRVFELHGLPEKGDVSDWFDAGGLVDDLTSCAAAVRLWEPSAVEPEPIVSFKLPTVEIVDDQGDDEPEAVACYGAFDKLNLTDLGNGERLVRLYGNKIRYVHPWKKWLVWDGRRWKTDDSERVYRFAKHTARCIYGECKMPGAGDDAKDIAGWAMASESKERIGAMVTSASRERGIGWLPKHLDQYPWLLNCRNGTVDLRTGQLRPHDPRDRLTKMAPVNFDPDAECPLFMETLRKFLVTDELIAFWQRLCGMAITGIVEDHILPIAYGTGSNGKSTLLGVLIDALGPDFAIKAAPDLLIAKKNDGHPTDRADLFGKRVVVAIETEDGQRLNESLVKELTGGDRIRARRMREDFWEFEPTHTVFLATNHKPQIRGTDHGIWRRLKLVPFSVQMPDSEAKKDVPRLLKKELPGILAWMVRGCLDWQRVGLAQPETVTEATQQYRQDEDVLGVFIAEHCVVHQSAKVKAGAIYARYKAWADISGLMALSMVKFGKAIEERGFQKGKSSTVFYFGIGLRAPEDRRDRDDDEPLGQLGQLGAESPITALDGLMGESTGESVPTVPTVPTASPNWTKKEIQEHYRPRYIEL